ncbi:MAG TPA: hypothetical protein VHE35_09450, partial [Kofleriaceae bacterium]|nr:hypothetical protein [Kofleriaceae bacterium]
MERRAVERPPERLVVVVGPLDLDDDPHHHPPVRGGAPQRDDQIGPQLDRLVEAAVGDLDRLERRQLQAHHLAQ